MKILAAALLMFVGDWRPCAGLHVTYYSLFILLTLISGNESQCGPVISFGACSRPVCLVELVGQRSPAPAGAGKQVGCSSSSKQGITEAVVASRAQHKQQQQAGQSRSNNSSKQGTTAAAAVASRAEQKQQQQQQAEDSRSSNKKGETTAAGSRVQQL